MSARVWPDEEPGLLGLLPLVYVAWSDLELDETEVRSIREMAGCDIDQTGVGAALATWLDPASPPSAAELAEVQRWIRQGGADPAHTPAGTLRRLEEAVGVEVVPIRAHQMAPRYVHAWPAPEVAPPEFDVEAFGDLLDGPYAEHRKQVREWLEDELFAPRDHASTEEERELTLRRLRRLAAHRFAHNAYPGVTTDHETMGPFLASFETLAQCDLSLWVKAGVQFGLFGGSVFFLGTERHHQHLADIADGHLLGCFAMTETGHGSNVRELGSVARYDAASEEFVIHTPHPGDRKDYVGNAGRDGRWATVFAQLEIGESEFGVHAFLVRIRDDQGTPAPGVTLVDNGRKMGLNGVDNGRIAFDQVRVPRDAMLDRFGSVTQDGTYVSAIASPSRRFFTMIGTLVGGRVSVANAALSAAKTALAIAVRYAMRRRQFGPPGAPEVPIASYPSHQRRLMPALATTVVLDLALEDLTSQYEKVALSDGDKREVEALAAGMKAFSTWHTTATIQRCREACGGAGYLAINQLPRLKADSDVFTTFEGDNTVLLQLVTKSLLTGFRQQFGEDRVYGLVRFLADRAEAAFHRINPFDGRATSSERLRDASLQQELMQRRTQDQLVQLSLRMQRLLGDGVPSFEAFSQSQPQALDLALSHIQEHVLQQAVIAEAAVEDRALRDVLASVRSLFALSHIEADLGWYLEHSYMAPVQAAAVRSEVAALCAEVAWHAPHIVDAFRIPSTCLSAPIAH